MTAGSGTAVAGSACAGAGSVSGSLYCNGATWITPQSARLAPGRPPWVRFYLLRWCLDLGRRYRSRRRRLYWNRQRIGVALLQRCDLDHADRRHGLHRYFDGGGFHLYGWILGDLG